MYLPYFGRDLESKKNVVGILAHVWSESWVAVRAQSCHQSDEQSVAGPETYRTSNFQEDAGHRVPKGCQTVKRDAEPPGEC